MYKVIVRFSDRQDASGKGINTYYLYEVGDAYPREGYKPKKGRITQLQNAKLIEKVAEEKTEE